METDDDRGYQSRYDRMAAGGHNTHFGEDTSLPGNYMYYIPLLLSPCLP